MSKPELKEILSLLKLKEKEKELAQLISRTTRDLIARHGVDEKNTARFDYESTDPEDDSRKYLSITLVDELAKMVAGEDSGRFVYTKRESSKVSYLKGKPKSMK